MEADATVLDLLNETPRLWSPTELARELAMTRPPSTRSLVCTPPASHCLGDFVFGSRGAELAARLTR